MAEAWVTEVPYRRRWHDSLVFWEYLAPSITRSIQCVCSLLPIRDQPKMPSIIPFRFSNTLLHNYGFEFFKVSSRTSFFRGLWNRKVMDRNPDILKLLEIHFNLDVSILLNSHFSITNGLTSSFKILIDSFSSVGGSSDWNSFISLNRQIFLDRPNIPRSAMSKLIFLKLFSNKNTDCTIVINFWSCTKYNSNLQIEESNKNLEAWIFLTMCQSKTTFYVLDHSFLHNFDWKYRGATAPWFVLNAVRYMYNSFVI